MTEPSTEARATEPNPVIDGRYQIHDELGSGSTAHVYRGMHLGTHRPVAVKLMNASLSTDPIAVERFLREARAAGSLTHRHIIEIIDVGSDTDKRPYLVTELLDGDSLQRYLERIDTPIPMAVLAMFVPPVLDALAFAHDAGIVHRDVKPANIILHRDHRGRVIPKLVDFGISKIARGANDPAVSLTIPGTLVGTPHYIAPEQALNSRSLDARADVWAAGVLLYRLVVGHVPFDGVNIGTLLGCVLSTDPPTPSSRGVAPALSDVIMRCLSKAPELRYKNARELKTAFVEAMRLAQNHPRDRESTHSSAPTVRPPKRRLDGIQPRPSDSGMSTSTLTARSNDRRGMSLALWLGGLAGAMIWGACAVLMAQQLRVAF